MEEALGRQYGTFLRDFARAAFWLRKAEQTGPLDFNENVLLAECYFRLGNRQMAVETLNRQSTFGTNTIKLLGEMGELTRALALAKIMADTWPDLGNLVAGDACRQNSRHKEAVEFYQKVLDLKPDPKRAGAYDRSRKRAAAAIEAISLFETLDLKRVADGSYTAEGLGYKGNIRVEVVVKAGRIEAVRIVEHREDRALSALKDVPRQIVEKQSLKSVDAITGATITSDAVVQATAKALSGGMK